MSNECYRITVNSNIRHVVRPNWAVPEDDFEESALAVYAETIAEHKRECDVEIAHQDQQGHELWETVFANGDVILMRHIH